jgi:hypothetical protein
MMDFSQATFRYEPYPIGLATGVFLPDRYAALVAEFPREETFKRMTGSYNKFSLSERNNPDAYARLIKEHPVWGQVYLHVKSPVFLANVFQCIAAAGLKPPGGKFTSRFEFSSLPSYGGGIDPHTDIPSKVVTLILPMVRPGEWPEEWGGGTDVLRPLDPHRLYQDYKEPRKAFEVVATYPYAPNQAVVFIKTFNSWHSVGPIGGEMGGPMRRTLTINIERAG